MELVVFTVIYIVSCLTGRAGLYYLSGGLLIMSAAGLALYNYKKSGRLTSPAVIFSLSWIGGVGISCLKLSNLATEWEMTTWICFYLAYAVFILCEKGTERLMLKEQIGSKGSVREREGSTSRFAAELNNHSDKGLLNFSHDILLVMDVISIVSVVCLIIEGFICGYIPVFLVDTPHAYSYFHVSGVHYFTVSCVLLPALGVLYLRYAYRVRGLISLWEMLNAAVCVSVGIILPILLVSRYQLLFGVMLAIAAFLVTEDGKVNIKLTGRTVLAAVSFVLAMLALYVFITIQRDHSAEYLNGIFEMKNEHMPIFISQPYIYIANNFDNFNCLVRDLPEHTRGLRMLFPVIALTGLKFIKPELAAFPIYVTKEELTTVTLFYDAFYDFGTIGVIILAGVLGLAAALLESNNRRSVCIYLIYAEFAIYLALSFFTTWFSNPTTWFDFGITALIGIFLYLRRKTYD
ncbi:MAG: O-antigen polymerase [Eubacteriales bacterium]|nr:O-antigen polymerase [Eubacteriales bacterium]